MPASPITGALRNAVRGAIRRGGFDVVRYDASLSPESRRIRLIEKQGVDVVLDVGAKTRPFAQALRSSGYAGRIVSFEPQSAAYAVLEAACGADPAREVGGSPWAPSRARPTCTSQETRRARHSSTWPASMSPRPRVAVHGHGARARAHPRLAPAELRPPNDRVYLKLDVQGFELDALRGAEETLSQTSVVESELSLAPLYHGAPDLMEIVNHLADRGFNLLTLEPVFVDPHDGRLLQVDGLFARSAG